MYGLIFILLVPMTVVSWFRPRIGVLCVLALLPTYVIRGAILGIPTTFLELSIYLTSIIWIIREKPKFNFRDIARKYKIWLLLGSTWLLSCIIGIMIASDSRAALGIFKGWIIDPILFTLIVSAVGASVTDKFRFWQECIFMLLIGASVVGGVAMLQFIQMDFIGRAKAWYDSPNVMAMYLVPIAVAAFGWVTVEAKGIIQHAWLWIWYFMIFLALIGIISSASISCILAVGVGIAVYIMFSVIKVSTVWLKIVGTLIIFVGLIIPWFSVNQGHFPLPTRNNELNGASSGEIRMIMWREAIDVIHKNPLLGVGLGQWQSYFSKLIKPGLRGALNPGYLVELHFASLFPHNLWLTTWLFTGILGLTSLVGLSLLVFYSSRSVVLPAAVLAAVLVIGIVDTPVYKNDLAIIFALVISAAIGVKTLSLYDRT